MPTPSTVGGNLAEAVQGLMRVNNPSTITLIAYVAIGASGAATVSQNGAVGSIPVTCVKNTTGIYDITYPPFAASATSLAYVCIKGIKSAAATVAGAYVKAMAPTSGTAQIVTFLATPGTPVEPASGDYFVIEICGALAGTF